MREEYYNIISQPQRTVFTKISLLNKQFKKVDELEGIVVNGTININVNSDIRRTLSMELVVKDSSFLIGNDKKIWMNKYIKVEIGIIDIKTNNIVYFNYGVFVINQPSLSYDLTTKNLRLKGLDLMAHITKHLGGVLKLKTQVQPNIPIKDAIKVILDNLCNFNNYIIEDTGERKVPFKIEKSAGTGIYDLLKEIKNLYMDYEMFVDDNGTFIFRQIRNDNDDPVVLDFTQLNKDLVLNADIDYDFENVKNKIIVNGKVLDNGTQVTYTKTNEDNNSPFNISKIDERTLVINDSKIFNNEQAKTRAEYEFWLHNDFNEKSTLEVVPIYFLKGNDKIKYENQDLEIEGEWLTQSLTVPLTYNNSMHINMIKIREIV
jgi:hypothetical protein